MIGGPCGAVNMYVDLPRQHDLGTLSTPSRSLPGSKSFQRPSDAKVAAPCNLDDWLMQQQSADPAEDLDEDYELTTSSITVAEDRSRRMLYDDPEEVLSPARPLLSEVAEAMAAAGTLSRSSQMHLFHKYHRPSNRIPPPLRSATVHKTPTRRQRTSSGGGAGARNKSPGRGRAVAASRTSYTFTALPVSVPVPTVAATSTTCQSRGRTSPLRRSDFRSHNSFLKNSVTVPAMWSGIADGLLSPRAKVAILGSRGLVSSRIMLPRANSTGRQRKNLLEDLRNQSRAAQEAITAPDFAERQQPSPIRPSHSRMRVTHDAVGLEPYSCLDEGIASTAPPPSAINPHPPPRSSRVLSPTFTSTTAGNLEAVTSWGSGTRVVVAPVYGGDPRPLGMRELPTGAPLLVGNMQEDPAEGHTASLRTAGESGLVPTTPLAAWLASSLAVADCDGVNGAGEGTDVGCVSVPTPSPSVLASSGVTPASPKESGCDGPADVLTRGSCPELKDPEACRTLVVEGAGACTAVTTPGTGFFREIAMKEAVDETPRGVASLEDRNASFSVAFDPAKPSLGGWPLDATPGSNGRSGLTNCGGQRSSTISIVEPVQVVHSCACQHEATMSSTVAASSPKTSVVNMLVTNGLLSQSPCLTATSQLLAIEDPDALEGASPALVRQLINIVQSQAAQIKDLYNCLSESRRPEVPEGVQPYTKCSSPMSGAGHLDLSRYEVKASLSGGETAGCNNGGSFNGGTLNAEARTSFRQLMASHSSSTNYHDSVGSLRSSREVQELLSCAVDGIQDRAGGLRRDGLQGCAGPSRLKKCSQGESGSMGGGLAVTAPDLCISASENSADPVAYDSWWISNGRGRGVRECANSAAAVDLPDSMSREGHLGPLPDPRQPVCQFNQYPGLHEVRPVNHAMAAAQGPTGHPTEAVAKQQEMTKLRLNTQAPGGKRASTYQPGLKATSESLERPGNRLDSAHNVQEGWRSKSGPTCCLGRLEVSNKLLVDKNQGEQQDREQQETPNTCRTIQMCFDEQQGIRSAAEHDLSGSPSGRQHAPRHVKLEVDPRDRGLLNDNQFVQPHNLQQEQRDGIRQRQPLEREISYQDQDLRAHQETQTSLNLRPSWNLITKALLSYEFQELRQWLSQVEVTASQEHKELHHQREHEQEPHQEAQQREYSRESRTQQEQQKKDNLAVAPCLAQEMQPGSIHELPTRWEEQLELSRYENDQERRSQAQEMRLTSLIDTVASLQQEVRWREESRRGELDQLAKGMEHVAACLLAALLPQGNAVAVSAETVSAAPSPPLLNGSLGTAQGLSSDAESEAVGIAVPLLLVAAKAGVTIPCSAASEATAAVGLSRSAGRTSSVARAGAQPASLSSDEVQRQLNALQQEMRRMRAVMAAQVVVAAATSASGGSGDSRPRHSPQQRETSSLQVSAWPSRMLPGTLDDDGGDVMQLHPQHGWELKQQGQLKEVQQQISQLRREFSELRSGEALVVEAQEAIVDLVNGMRRELDELRQSMSTFFTAGMAGSAPQYHTTAVQSASNDPGAGPKRRKSLLQELCSSQSLVDFMSQEAQKWENQSGATWPSQEPCQRSNLPMRHQHSVAELPDPHQHQNQPDQIADIVATIQSVNVMLNDSLMQVMSKIQAQGDELAELKRCMASVAAGQRQQ